MPDSWRIDRCEWSNRWSSQQCRRVSPSRWFTSTTTVTLLERTTQPPLCRFLFLLSTNKLNPFVNECVKCARCLTQPAKTQLRRNRFCWIGIQYVLLYRQKYTPPHYFFCNFAGYVNILLKVGKGIVHKAFSCLNPGSVFTKYRILSLVNSCFKPL